MTARLFLVLSLYLNLFANGLAVGDTRSLELDFGLEFIFEFGCDNVEMLLTESRKHHFARFLIQLVCNCRVFLHQSRETGSNLFLVALLCGVNRH